MVATQNQPKPLDIACSAHTLTDSDDVWQSAPGNMTISLTERIASPVAAGERSGIAMNENAGSGRAGKMQFQRLGKNRISKSGVGQRFFC